MENLEYYLAIAKDAARQAGSLIKKNYASFEAIIAKEEKSYYTASDVMIDEFYRNFLKQATPEIDIYSEELGATLPVCAGSLTRSTETSNYRVGVPFFATQLCLLRDGAPVAAVIYSPIMELEFTAVKGKGAFLNGKKISCADGRELSKAAIIVSKGHSNKAAGEIIARFGDFVRTVRIFSATSLDTAFVASGKFDATINYSSKVWDYAPGALLVREAGGLVKNFSGGDWTIKDNNLIAANKYLMPKVLEIIRQMPLAN